MPKAPDFDAAAAHKYFAAHCFNSSWPLIEKAERSPEEDLELVALGHASLWHWTQRADCTSKNLSIAHWLLSRIYAVLREPAQAQRYAASCLRISQEPGIEPFYLAFAYEAVARAAALASDWPAASSAFEQAGALAEQVDEAENRKLLLDDLATVQAITLRPAHAGDFEELLALRIAAMRESLERIGRFNLERARERFSAGFAPESTRHILLGTEHVGFVAVKPRGDGLLLDHLYVLPRYQGKRIGSYVLQTIFAEADAAGLPIRVGALRDSDSNRFYRRHGFSQVEESEWDIYYSRPRP